MAALFADENFSGVIVRILRGLGHDVVTTVDAGLAGVRTGDPIILATATTAGRPVVTLNRWDFIRLHNADPNHAGIIACTSDHDVAALAARIDAVVRATPNLAGQLVRVIKPHKP